MNKSTLAAVIGMTAGVLIAVTATVAMGAPKDKQESNTYASLQDDRRNLWAVYQDGRCSGYLLNMGIVLGDVPTDDVSKANAYNTGYAAAFAEVNALASSEQHKQDSIANDLYAQHCTK